MNEINIEQIDLNLLKCFEILYEEQNASRAAERLGITQSAVSASLRRLRDIYQDPLFQRTGRGLAPTTKAHALKPLVSNALNIFRETLISLPDNTNTLQQRIITLGMSDDFEIAFAQEIIEQVRLKFPHYRIVIKQTYMHIIAEMLVKHNVDIGVTSGGIYYHSLYRELMVLGDYSCLVTHPEDAVELTLDKFLSFEHLLISNTAQIGIVDEHLTKLNKTRHIFASTSHFAAIPWLLKRKGTVCTLPTHAARKISGIVPSLIYTKCPISIPTYPMVLSCRKTSLKDKAILDVQEVIRSVINSYK